MPELRWALIGLSVLFLAGLALWEWRKSKRRHFTHAHIEPAAAFESTDRARRLEPSIDGVASGSVAADMGFDVPTIHPVEPVRVAVSAGSAVDVPAAARFGSSRASVELPAAIQWPPVDAGRVLGLRVVGARGEPLSGRSVRAALEAAGLRHGPQHIYHLTTVEGAVLVSVANLVRPGSFDPAVMDTQQFRGLNVFSVVPGPLSPLRMLDELTGLARTLAQRLGAVVQDADGQDLDSVRLAQLQESLAEEAP
jgi:cell division protein ZipA